MSEDFIPEWELTRKVVRRCSCRGFVGVDEYPLPEAIALAVSVHQKSDEHRHWSDRGGMEAELDRRDEGTFPVRIKSAADRYRRRAA